MNDVDTLRKLREWELDSARGLGPDSDGHELAQRTVYALDAAIAALEAGRSGEAGCYVHESALRLLAEGQEAVATSIYRETLGGRVYLAPQQPPPDVDLLPLPEQFPKTLENWMLNEAGANKADAVRSDLRAMLRSYAKENVAHALRKQPPPVGGAE